MLNIYEEVAAFLTNLRCLFFLVLKVILENTNNVEMYKVENEGLLAVILLLEMTIVNSLVNLIHGKYLAFMSPFSIPSLMIEINNSLWFSFPSNLDVLKLPVLAAISGRVSIQDETC